LCRYGKRTSHTRIERRPDRQAADDPPATPFWCVRVETRNVRAFQCRDAAKGSRRQSDLEVSYFWLAQWIDRHAPETPLHDGKAAAAGKDSETEPPADAAEQAADDFGALGKSSKR
jgi:hypothetical protein